MCWDPLIELCWCKFVNQTEDVVLDIIPSVHSASVSCALYGSITNSESWLLRPLSTQMKKIHHLLPPLPSFLRESHWRLEVSLRFEKWTGRLQESKMSIWFQSSNSNIPSAIWKPESRFKRVRGVCSCNGRCLRSPVRDRPPLYDV